jgi:hypothetical protein
MLETRRSTRPPAVIVGAILFRPLCTRLAVVDPMCRSRRCLELVVILLALLTPGRIFAVSCTTQAQMSEAERTALTQAAQALASAVQSGKSAAVQALTIPKVKAQFDPIASMIEQTAPLLAGATVTIDALYELNASDLKAAAEDTVFFCNAPGSQAHADLTIPQLPQGQYALALVHATGVQKPQQMAFLLQKEGGWQLAGLFVKPLLMAGHDSVWYWTKARAFSQKGQKWNGYFYYKTAAYLATPADFLTSPNLDKLNQEAAASMPEGLPGAQPMTLKTFSISDVHTDGSLGGLDLVIRYAAGDVGDPVATRARNLEVMKAMLEAHPELREGFHGLWVFAESASQRPFGNELAMSDIH